MIWVRSGRLRRISGSKLGSFGETTAPVQGQNWVRSGISPSRPRTRFVRGGRGVGQRRFWVRSGKSRRQSRSNLGSFGEIADSESRLGWFGEPPLLPMGLFGQTPGSFGERTVGFVRRDWLRSA